MSRLIARILLSIMIFPLSAVVYLIVFALCLKFFESMRYFSGDPERAFLVCGVLTWLFMAGYWFLLWSKSVRWTGQRVGLTLAAIPASVLAAAIVGAATSGFDEDFAIFMGSITFPLLWLVATIFIWRDSAAERAARVVGEGGREGIVCPTCGYNLTGLKEARCPECGSQFTLDQLLASQPSRLGAELEK